MKRVCLLVMLCIAKISVGQVIIMGKAYLKGEPITDAKVEIRKINSDTLFGLQWTDFDGSYKIKSLKLKLYDTLLIRTEFLDLITSDTIVLKSNNIYHAIFIVKTESIAVVSNLRNTASTVFSATLVQKMASNVLDISSIEEFKKTGRLSSIDMIKRVPSVTILDGKFAIIRGMNDRYNAVMLNNGLFPYTENDKKSVSLDLFPAVLLDNITVYKSGMASLTGDFGGAVIKITTKSIPEQKVFNVTFGNQINSFFNQAKLQSFEFGNKSQFGLIGKDHRIPVLPNSAPNTNAEKLAQTQKFNNNWTTKSISQTLSPYLTVNFGLPVKLKNSGELGLVGAFNYSYMNSGSLGTVNTYDLSDNRLMRNFKDTHIQFVVNNGAVANLSWKINNRHRLDWKNFGNIVYNANSDFRAGLADADDQKTANVYASNATQNVLINSQFGGSHSFYLEDETKQEILVNWGINYTHINKLNPDYRIASYTILDTNRILSLSEFINSGSGRLFSKLKEETLNSTIEIAYKVDLNKFKNMLRAGIVHVARHRDFEQRIFVYAPNTKAFFSKNMPQTDLNFDALTKRGIYLQEKTDISVDNYTANTNLFAGYVMVENEFSISSPVLKFTKLGRINYGFRVEENQQLIKNEQYLKLHKNILETGKETDFLPSINLLLPFGKKLQTRFSYYKTLNRPELREQSPYSFYNNNSNSEIKGNPLLKRAELHNFDIRLEWYSAVGGLFTITGFKKRIINPIEMQLDPTQAGIRTFTFTNEESAILNGLELELRQNIGSFFKVAPSSIFNGLTLYGNFSYIDSKIHLKSGSTGTENRPLQGQSPYASNASLFYEGKKGFVFSINFNKIGDRIAYIGSAKNIQPFGLDIYEKSRTVLDLQIGKNFGKLKNHKLRINLFDLINHNSIFFQDINENGWYDSKDNLLISQKTGRTMMFSYTYQIY